MAVEIKYVVVRKGEETMTFSSKKEADAWDKMLDMADVFTDWLLTRVEGLAEEQAEAIGLQLAEHKEVVQQILRTGKRPQQDNTESEAPPAQAIRAVDAA